MVVLATRAIVMVENGYRQLAVRQDPEAASERRSSQIAIVPAVSGGSETLASWPRSPIQQTKPSNKCRSGPSPASWTAV